MLKENSQDKTRSLTLATRTIECRAANLDCEHGAATLKRGIESLPGLSDVNILPRAARITLTYDPAATIPKL
ncbi:heavy-metal-associated domain-containing protein [Thalassospira profundimaris]|nr:heavy-metal-associated domain-containing protein [Thalassospira profundimaris]